MNLIILSPEKEMFNGEATSVKVPGLAGQFEVLNNHAPIISALSAGEIRVLNGSERTTYPVNGGFIEVLHNRVSITCN
ncbi:MAG: synthase subunit epsilon [Bacteroidota bacterium]|jgi:F-type H+-transporting ATPase subunit epsilon